jgi:hypothetical protein
MLQRESQNAKQKALLLNVSKAEFISISLGKYFY